MTNPPRSGQHHPFRRHRLGPFLLGLAGVIATLPGAADTPPGGRAPDLQTGGASDPRLDAGLPWASCTHSVIAPPSTAPIAIEIRADSAETSVSDGKARFSGDVVLTHGNDRLHAARIDFDRDSGDLDASGRVLLRRPDLRLGAQQVRYNLNTRLGQAEHAEYRLPGILARGTAQRAELTGPGTGRYQDISYTTCPPGNDDWRLTAETLDIDTNEGLGTAHSARLAFKGVPVAYLPVLTFPIDDRRRSGFLVPGLGYSDTLGMDLRIPYYFNLAPNYDLTLTPRLLERRGLLLGSELRFLTTAHRGDLRIDYLHNDRLAGKERRRGLLSLHTYSRFTPQLGGQVHIDHVSDDTFLSDFGSDSPYRLESYLERSITLDYFDTGLSATVELQSPQTIDTAIALADRPYATLPRINIVHDDALRTRLPADYSLAFEYANFAKNGSPVEGQRFDLEGRLAFPMSGPWYTITPAASLRYTRYRLDTASPAQDEAPDRWVPSFEIDNRWYFDRQTEGFGTRIAQTLVPRLHYVYTPRIDQSALPVFDTARRGVSFSGLFLPNRFTGIDRIGDTHHLTWSLNSSSHDAASGRHLASLGIAQTLYFADREVQLPGDPVETSRLSPLFAHLTLDLPEDIIASGQAAWDHDKNTFTYSILRAAYRPDRERLLSLSYSTSDQVSSEADLGIIWPIGERTRAIARWKYSFSEGRNLDALAGIEYGKCCWRLRALLRQQVTGSGSAQNLSFLLQIELNGLGKLGDNIDALLKNGIYGYRRYDD